MLGQKLKSACLARGYSLEELARRTGFSQSFLSQIENAKNSPSIASLKKITQTLEVSIGELFEADRGEQIYFSSAIPHRWKNPGVGTMRALWVISPPSF